MLLLFLFIYILLNDNKLSVVFFPLSTFSYIFIVLIENEKIVWKSQMKWIKEEEERKYLFEYSIFKHLNMKMNIYFWVKSLKQFYFMLCETDKKETLWEVLLYLQLFGGSLIWIEHFSSFELNRFELKILLFESNWEIYGKIKR